MLAIIAGVCIAGSTLLIRKLYTSVNAVLRLSEELDPLRPQAQSDLKTSSQSPRDLIDTMSHPRMTHEDELCGESILRLSGAVGSGNAYLNSKRISEPPEVTVATGCPETPR